MLTGLDILLDRMKTNPEEFLEEGRHVPYEGQQFGGKWADLVTYAWRVSTEEERKMLEDAQRQFYRDDFNERVFKRLAGEENIQLPETVAYKAQGRYATGWNDPRAVNAVPQQTHPLQNAAAQQQTLQGVIQGGMYDPNTHKLVNAFGQAPIKAEGQFASYGADTYLSGGGDKGFFGLGKLFGK